MPRITETLMGPRPKTARSRLAGTGAPHALGAEWDTLLYRGRGSAGAWISPRGDLHVLQRGENHPDWVRKHARQLGVGSADPERELLSSGWIKKSDASTYEASSLDDHTVRRVRRHMREHHPDESHFALQVGRGRGTRGYTLPVWEAAAGARAWIEEILAGRALASVVDRLLG